MLTAYLTINSLRQMRQKHCWAHDKRQECTLTIITEVDKLYQTDVTLAVVFVYALEESVDVFLVKVVRHTLFERQRTYEVLLCHSHFVLCLGYGSGIVFFTLGYACLCAAYVALVAVEQRHGETDAHCKIVGKIACVAVILAGDVYFWPCLRLAYIERCLGLFGLVAAIITSERCIRLSVSSLSHSDTSGIADMSE